MVLFFINIRFLDVLDILLVAYLIYFVYNLIKGSVAINIFVGVIAVYFIWRMVSILKMEMLGEILGQFFSVGVIALIIVFQQEIRQFLFMLGKARVFDKGFKLKNILLGKWHLSQDIFLNTAPIIKAVENMSQSFTGALIVITRKNELNTYVRSGEVVNADISAPLIESIFYKNNPLHDGALVISQNRIRSAKCVLPLIDSEDFPKSYGLRHRAAAGVTKYADAIAIVVSEQTGHVALAVNGKLYAKQTTAQLKKKLEKHLYEK